MSRSSATFRRPKGLGVVPANERLKSSFEPLVWGGIIAAVAVHFAVFTLWPRMRAPDISVRGTVQARSVQDLAIPPDVTIPAAPRALPRPATPVLASSPVPRDVTIPKVDFASLGAGTLPRPPAVRGGVGSRGGSEDVSAHPTFTPYDINPAILNREQVIRAIKRYYPTIYRETRTGGVVLMYLYIDEKGHVLHSLVAQGSGYPQLDSAAVKVANVYRFSPALYRNRKTSVWVQIPIVFSVQEEER